MSLITLLNTKSIVADSISTNLDFKRLENDITYDEINTSKYENNLNKRLIDMLKKIFDLQYNLIFTYYNKNTVNKAYFGEIKSTNLSAKKELEYYYQHQYLHNHAAIFDEIFEQKDAVNALYNPMLKYDKKYGKYLLFLEESIDILHFAVEYGCLFAEHLVLLEDLEYTKKAFPCCIYEDEGFRDRVSKKIHNLLDMNNIKYSNISKHTSSVIDGEGFVESIFRDCRDIMRTYAFKDWKVYPEDFYNRDKLETLFSKVITLIYRLYNFIYKLSDDFGTMFDRYVREVFMNVDFRYIQANKRFRNFISVFYIDLIYGCYVAKNWINMQRQTSDPRYNAKHFGEIIGVEV